MTHFTSTDMANFKKETYTNIPEWAIYALEYGVNEDQTLNDEERKMVLDFQALFDKGYVMVVNWDSRGFSAFPEFGLACDTYEVDFYIPID